MSTMGEIHLNKEQILNIYSKLKTEFESACNCKVEYAGSVLRYKDIDTDRTFGDLDLIMIYPNGVHPKEISDLVHSKYNVKRFGAKKASFLIDGVQVDLNATTEEEVEPLRLTCIGDSQFNLLVRSRAKKMGYRLNEYGLWKENERIALTQRDILGTLHIRWYEPSERSFKEHKNFHLEKVK